MNGKQIKEEVIRYLEDDNYRYAILIDGEWGCGKTYFVTHELLDAITDYEKKHSKRKVRYISLYGCKSVDEVEENIYCSMLDEQFYEKYYKIKKGDNFYGEKKEKIKRKGEIITNVSRKIVGTIMQRFEISYKAYEYVSDFFMMNKNIFIFDDLERCGCSPNDILGYINGLVEHEGAKVILVAYEDEIGFLYETGKKELQYMVAADERIQIPQEKSMFSSIGQSENKPVMNIEELVRRRGKIFADMEINQQYIKIREKLIGMTLKYETDMVAIMHLLIRNSKITEELKRKLNDNVQGFIGTMTTYEHRNLRTFQFFLSKIKYLVEQFNETEIDKRYTPAALDFMIGNCFMLCVEYKADVKEPEERFAKICFQNERRLKSVKDYVEHSSFDKNGFKTEIAAYVESELSNRLPSDDPYSQLYSQHYIRTQEWVEEKIEQVLEKLKNNEYRFNVYSNMLVLFLQLIEYGFPEEIMLKAEKYMIENAKQSDKERILDDFISSEKPEVIEKCKGIIQKINREVKIAKENFWQMAIQDILQRDEFWGKELETYWINNKQYIPSDVQLLSGIDADAMAEKIIQSNAENILNFRSFLDWLYPQNVRKLYVDEDMKTISAIIEKLEGYDESDLIKKAQLKHLREQLVQIKQHQQSN